MPGPSGSAKNGRHPRLAARSHGVTSERYKMVLGIPIARTDAERFATRRCVVTGGLGFIGSNLSLWLAAAGAHVTVIDALISSHGGDRRNIDGAAGPIEVIVA